MTLQPNRLSPPFTGSAGLRDSQYYAARHLLPGRILVESDLAVGQQVVVLTQAIHLAAR